MAKSIAFVHRKGGTGKTTACLNMAGWLVKMNRQVLVVDLDPQGSATAGLGVDRKAVDGSMFDVLFSQGDIAEVLLETASGVYLAPSSSDLMAMETDIASRIDDVGILRRQLETVENLFDYILVDVPPAATMLMVIGIAASGNIIIPLDSGVFAYESMEALKKLLLDLNEEYGVDANIMMVLLRRFSGSPVDNSPTREVRKMLDEFLAANDLASVEVCTIPFSKKIHNAQMKGMPVSHYAPHSSVARAYKKMTKAVLNYG